MTTAESGTATARLSYETLEPFHVLSYFSPHNGAAAGDLGISPSSVYVGGRAAPMGACAPSVVVSAFYNFSPKLITESWNEALGVGLDAVHARRYQVIDSTLRDVLGDAITGPEIAELAQRFREIGKDLPLNGRPLAAAWASSPAPEPAHLTLWYAVAVLREWRGDNHIAVLVAHELDGIDAAVFHEADTDDPSIRRRTIGRALMLFTRGYDESDWEASVDRLLTRGLVERTESGHRLTEKGVSLYHAIEDQTDQISAGPWTAPGAADLLERVRPYVKSVLDAGILPGTRKKS